MYCVVLVLRDRLGVVEVGSDRTFQAALVEFVDDAPRAKANLSIRSEAVTALKGTRRPSVNGPKIQSTSSAGDVPSSLSRSCKCVTFGPLDGFISSARLVGLLTTAR